MKKFEEISKESQNFFDYIVHFNMKKYVGDEEVIENTLSMILEVLEEFKLNEEYFYKEKLNITYNLVKERIQYLKKVTTTT